DDLQRVRAHLHEAGLLRILHPWTRLSGRRGVVFDEHHVMEVRVCAGDELGGGEGWMPRRRECLRAWQDERAGQRAGVFYDRGAEALQAVAVAQVERTALPSSRKQGQTVDFRQHVRID